ncbi:sporulation histidine kinase inhibitor Sda [Paenibacillaceae bacterium T2]|uniref:Sporulation histidine kinase inhibitor Sda n=1 Tax=Ferviditalea candida TaxID=3108399 RepID=A0ABU5ZI75_9BACL|nr:sporulation histidine kinase inhibitor Sda [Paenibacillaceae bacterium T2]
MSDEHLLDCYQKALSMNTEPAFIELLTKEVEKRKLLTNQRHTKIPAVPNGETLLL